MLEFENVMWTKSKVFSPDGLSMTIVWFADSLLWHVPDLDLGPQTFQVEIDADFYILLICSFLRDEGVDLHQSVLELLPIQGDDDVDDDEEGAEESAGRWIW